MTTSEMKMSQIIGGGYDEFWNCKKRYRVLKGGKGSKKSATTALNFIYRLMKMKDSNLLVVRQVMNTHRDSTFAQLKWAQEKLGGSHLWQNNVSPMEMTYTPTGQKILFRGFDDVLKLASTTCFTVNLVSSSILLSSKLNSLNCLLPTFERAFLISG